MNKWPREKQSTKLELPIPPQKNDVQIRKEYDGEEMVRNPVGNLN